MQITVLLVAFVLASCHAQTDGKKQPPQIMGGFPKVMYFSHFSDVQTLECKATGIPDVQYQWKKNGAIINDGQDDFEIVEGKLTLASPQKRDEGYYQCFAMNAYGKAMSTVAQILKADLPGYTNLPIADQSFNVGQHGVLTCRNQPDSVPVAVYDWYIDKSATVAYSPRVVIDQQGDLHFINIEENDELQNGPGGVERTYNCSLYNAYTSSRVYGSATRLRVNPGNPTPRDPTINTHTPADQAIAYVGQPITLQCIPDGFPLPTIQWSKPGGKLPLGRHEIRAERYTLVIENIAEDDEGNYLCTAVQGSKEVNQNIFVDVKSSPIWVNKLKSLTRTEGQMATFNCLARSARGETDAVETKWFKNGNPLSSGTTGKIKVSGSELEVQNIQKPDDLMNIQCNVSNTVGYEIADAFLNVLKPTILDVQPDPKHLIEAGKVERLKIHAVADPLYASQMTYTWAHDGKPITGKKENGDPVYKDDDNALVINATTFEENQEFLKLTGNYTCSVSLGLEDGTGDVLVYSNVYSDNTDKKPIIIADPENLWWIGLIVAIIVIIIVIIIFCCCLYRNRGQTYPVDEKERKAGHDPEKELADSGFQDLSRADSPDEKKPRGGPEQESLLDDKPMGGDTDSLDEFGEPDSSKFNEDGSFIGDYGAKKGRDTSQSAV